MAMLSAGRMHHRGVDCRGQQKMERKRTRKRKKKVNARE